MTNLLIWNFMYIFGIGTCKFEIWNFSFVHVLAIYDQVISTFYE